MKIFESFNESINRINESVDMVQYDMSKFQTALSKFIKSNISKELKSSVYSGDYFNQSLFSNQNQGISIRASIYGEGRDSLEIHFYYSIPERRGGSYKVPNDSQWKLSITGRLVSVNTIAVGRDSTNEFKLDLDKFEKKLRKTFTDKYIKRNFIKQ